MSDFADITPWLGNISAVIVAALGGLGGWLAARVKASADMKAAQAAAESSADAARAAHSGPEWDMYVKRLEAHFDRRLSEQDEKIDSLNEKVSRLRAYIDEVRAQYHAALLHIFAWRELHPESIHKLTVPPEIREDVNSRFA